MIQALACLFALLLPALLGFFLWDLVQDRNRRNHWESLSFAFPMGFGVVSVLMLLLANMKLPLTGILISLIQAVLIISLVLIAWKRSQHAEKTTQAGDPCIIASGRTWIWWMFLGVIGIELLFLTASLIKNPIITDWDGWAIWGLKAKAFFTNQGFHQYLSRASDLGFSWPARPCLSSIFQAYVYLLCGQVNELAGRIAHLAISISLLLLFYSTLRRRLTAQTAMVWTAMLATIPNLAYIASAGLGNLPLALFLFSAVSALDRWKSEGTVRIFAASSAFLGFALLSRDEALGLGVICAASVLLLSPRLNPTPLLRKIFQTVLLLAGAFAIYSLWSRIVRPYNIFDLRSIWLSQELLLRVQSHLPDLTAVLKSILDELTKPSEQSLASPLEKHWGVSFFWVIFAWTFVFSGIRAMFRRHFRGILHQQSSLEISCGICTLLGLMAYSAGLWLFPYANFKDLAFWSNVLDRHVLSLVPIAACYMAHSFRIQNESQKDVRYRR